MRLFRFPLFPLCCNLRFAGAAAALLLLAPGCRGAAAQSAMPGMAGMQMKPVPPPESLPVPVKMTGIGNSHLTITATPEGQAWFDQGLNLTHDFWDYEAAKAFEQGVRSDPNCAMCYWGLYQATMSRERGPSAYSEKALANAVRLKRRVGKEEQLYIEATVAGNKAVKAAGPDEHLDDTREIAIWRKVVKNYPKDTQAKIFLAESLRDGFDGRGEPKKGSRESDAILEEVLKANPNDSAANHYWIHAMEPGNHPERALASAQLLASLAPASGHMVHMPGHIFYRVGDYHDAERWFAESQAVDEKYMREQHVAPDDEWNYIHNLMYEIANLMEEGKLNEAMALSRKSSEGRGELRATLYTNLPRDGMARLNPQLPVALRAGDWAGVVKMLGASKPDARFANLNFLALQLRDYALGMQAMEAGDVTTAQQDSDKLDSALRRMSQRIKDEPKQDSGKADTTGPVMVSVMPDAKARPLLDNLSLMSLELRASLLAGQKKLPEAKALFTQAAKQEKDLGYHEPPMFIRPVGETEGYALLRAGDYAGAHTAFAAAVAERPNSGFGLYGEARSSEAAGNTAQARTEYAAFEKAWKSADADLPETQHAHEYLAAHQQASPAAETPAS